MQSLTLPLLLCAIALLFTTTAKMQCPPHVIAAASGIHLNIVAQGAELVSVKALQKMESNTSHHHYSTKFAMGKGEVVANIEAGMSIRAFNQKILPGRNEASAGLATVKAAQKTELSLAKSLTGNQSHDHKVLATLVTDIENGTEQNKKNLAAAIHGCSLGFNFE